MADKKKKKSGFTLACVILVLLVVFILFLVKKDTIITNLKETHFFDRVFGTTPEFVENHQSSTKEEKSDEKQLSENSTITIKVETEQKAEESEKPIKKEENNIQPKNEQNNPEKTESQSEQKVKENSSVTITTEVTYTELQLCFVEIDSEGSVIRKIIKRAIPKNDSPLSTSLKLLLEGPDTTKSAEKNCMSLIPDGTKLLGAKVKDGVAYLDFNEAFEFNSYGVEGYNAQLMQIVYTATSFSTVKSVQFLIEGEKKDYLGSEGQWIGSPLSRGSF